MMRGLSYSQTHSRCGWKYLYTYLLGIILFTFLPERSWLTTAWNSLPDPASFPANLRAVYNDVSSKFNCDFNEGHSCEFSPGRGWSFQQSFHEFALKVQEAARAGTDTTQQKTNDSHLQTVILPELGHFLCSVAGSGNNVSSFPPLEAKIPWPRFVPFAIPLTVTDETSPTGTDTPEPLATRTKRRNRSGEILSRTVEVEDSSPMACMQLSLRFPPQRAIQVNLSFDSRTQVVNLDPELTHSDVQPSHTSLRPTTQWPIVPRNVWLVLTVPLFNYQASEQEIEASGHENRSLLFTSQGLTWMAVLKTITVSLRATSDVCVDNFILQPLFLSGETCFRGLTWRDPQTGMNHTILLDSSGLDVATRQKDLIRKSLEERQQLLLTENGTFIGQSRWFRFTGALTLAICATFLFLLFTTTLCISIALTRRRKPPSLVPRTPSRTVHSGSRNRIYRPPDYTEDSLLPRIRKSKPEEETQSSGTEPVSTENGESLFQHDGNTCRSMVPENGETETLDPMTTSAMQLARNWFLYRNRGDRLRQRPNVGYPIAITPPIIPYPPPSPLATSASSPYAVLKHPTDKVCMPSSPNTQTPSDPRPTSPPPANFRHSLVLSVDDQDQLIILPSAQSITNSMHRATAPGMDSFIHEVDERESENDGDSMDSQHNTPLTMHQNSHSLTNNSSNRAEASEYSERNS